MTPPQSLASVAESAAQAELHALVEELKSFVKRLRAVHRSLAPPSDVEAAQEDQEDEDEDEDEERDISTEIRSVIECVLADSLEPAIRDLQAAALYGTRKDGIRKKRQGDS